MLELVHNHLRASNPAPSATYLDGVQDTVAAVLRMDDWIAETDQQDPPVLYDPRDPRDVGQVCRRLVAVLRQLVASLDEVLDELSNGPLMAEDLPGVAGLARTRTGLLGLLEAHQRPD